MVTSDFRSEVKIRPLRACAMKNMQYNRYLWPNWRNFRVLKKIESRNTMATSDLRAEVEILHNASGHNYRNSSFIVDLAIGHIPRSTESTCISS